LQSLRRRSNGNVEEQRIKQLIYEEGLKAEKVGNQWIILESDLELVENRQTGRPPKDKDSEK